MDLGLGWRQGGPGREDGRMRRGKGLPERLGKCHTSGVPMRLPSSKLALLLLAAAAAGSLLLRSVAPPEPAPPAQQVRQVLKKGVLPPGYELHPPEPASVVFRDPKTGEFRAPRAGERGALHGARAAAFAAGPRRLRRGFAVGFDAVGADYMVVTRRADGTLETSHGAPTAGEGASDAR